MAAFMTTLALRGLLMLAGLGALAALSAGCNSEVRREVIELQKYLDRVDARQRALEWVLDCESSPCVRERLDRIRRGPFAYESAGEKY